MAASGRNGGDGPASSRWLSSKGSSDGQPFTFTEILEGFSKDTMSLSMQEDEVDGGG